MNRRAHVPRAPLDDRVAEGMLAGRLGPEEVAPDLAELAELLAVARLATSAEPDADRMASTVRAMSLAARSSATQISRPAARKTSRAVTSLAAAAAALSLMGGLAAADVLPETVEHRVRVEVAKVVDRAGLRTVLTPVARADARDEAPLLPPAHPDNHGGAVSSVAQSPSTTGREHGEAVSTVARSDAGKPDRAADPTERPASTGQPGAKPEGTHRPDEPTHRAVRTIRLECASSGTSAVVTCQWGRSEDRDFGGYRLWRREGGGDKAVISSSNERSGTSFSDRTVHDGSSYGYLVEVVDRDGRPLARSQAVRVDCCAATTGDARHADQRDDRGSPRR